LKKTFAIDRIIDANLNRLKEGIRVCEEITRFILDDKSLTARFKAIRHEISGISENLPDKCRLLKGRYSEGDVGRKTHHHHELKRSGVEDIFFANIQRVKESLRVLEEFLKLKNTPAALRFKDLRYSVYELEKKAFTKIKSLRYHR